MLASLTQPTLVGALARGPAISRLTRAAVPTLPVPPSRPNSRRRWWHPSSYNPIRNGDAFVTKLNATGTGLSYSTFLGGDGIDFGNGIAVDASGSAYVIGDTGFWRPSPNFPTTAGAFDTSFDSTGSGATDAFVTKLNPLGTALAYSTYLGGSDYEATRGAAVDAAGNAYVTGSAVLASPRPRARSKKAVVAAMCLSQSSTLSLGPHRHPRLHLLLLLRLLLYPREGRALAGASTRRRQGHSSRDQKTQRFRSVITAVVSCGGEPCAARASGTIKVPSTAKLFKLRPSGTRHIGRLSDLDA